MNRLPVVGKEPLERDAKERDREGVGRQRERERERERKREREREREREKERERDTLRYGKVSKERRENSLKKVMHSVGGGIRRTSLLMTWWLRVRLSVAKGK